MEREPMANASIFIIDNDSGADFDVYIEPECIVVHLKHGDCLTVRDHYSASPVTVRIGKDRTGQAVISLWPGDGDVVVEKNGANVLD